jgi:hypothetical protein
VSDELCPGDDQSRLKTMARAVEAGGEGQPKKQDEWLGSRSYQEGQTGMKVEEENEPLIFDSKSGKYSRGLRPGTIESTSGCSRLPRSKSGSRGNGSQ